MSKQSAVYVAILLMIVGLELRAVESFVLRPETTRVLANITEPDSAVGSARKYVAENAPIKKVMTPPTWVGWAFMSVGVIVAVFALRKMK